MRRLFDAFVALAVVGLIVLVHTLDFNRYFRLAVEELKRTTGREARVGGELEVKVDFLRLAIAAGDVAFGNAPWGSRAEMAKIKRIEGEIALLPLLRRKISLVRFVAVEPDVLLGASALHARQPGDTAAAPASLEARCIAYFSYFG
jgi:uncharacterized protein involved in outer membrane biogenesis